MKQRPGALSSQLSCSARSPRRSERQLPARLRGAEREQRKGRDPGGEQGGNPLRRTGTHLMTQLLWLVPSSAGLRGGSPAAAFQGFPHDSCRREHSPKTSTPPAGASAETPEALSVKHFSRTAEQLVPNVTEASVPAGEGLRAAREKRGHASSRPGTSVASAPGRLAPQVPPIPIPVPVPRCPRSPVPAQGISRAVPAAGRVLRAHIP